MNFKSPFDPTLLSAAQWAVLAGIPTAIIALYFLKLRRKPVKVPSTLLWRKSMEDMHVNSLFQKLRRNLLLFLQLLMVFLVMLAVARPRFGGNVAAGQKYVILLDNSASMSAVDAGGSRLAKAKEEAKKIVESMASTDLAMVISFSDRAKVEASYTGNKSLLRKVIERVEPSERSTSLREALEVAAGLANPSKQFSEGEGVVASSVSKPKLILLTDGGFPDVSDFSLGNLEPNVVVIGAPPPPYQPREGPADAPAKTESNPSDNLAIIALKAGRNEEKPDEFQVFGRVKNYRGDETTTAVKLLKLDLNDLSAPGKLIDAIELKIPAQSEQAFKFDLPDSGAAAIEARIDPGDAAAFDNRAFAVINKPRRAQTLIVTQGNKYLVDTLKTPTMLEAAEFTEVKPEEADSGPVAAKIKEGAFDLVIYDGHRPKEPPEANAFYFGVLPPGEIYDSPKDVESPIILDWDLAHPIMQYIRDLGQVFVLKAKIVEPPPGTTTLIGGNSGPLAFLQPRQGYQDLVVAFSLLDGKNFNTNWPLKISFPLFLYNCMRVLGNIGEASDDGPHPPGKPIVLRADSLVETMSVAMPGGGRESLARNAQGVFILNDADSAGVYVSKAPKTDDRAIAVNLMDPAESDLATRGLVPAGAPAERADDYRIKIGYNTVEKGSSAWAPAKVEWWPPLAAAALAILLLEWYIYNKRVYV